MKQWFLQERNVSCISETFAIDINAKLDEYLWKEKISYTYHQSPHDD